MSLYKQDGNARNLGERALNIMSLAFSGNALMRYASMPHKFVDRFAVHVLFIFNHSCKASSVCEISTTWFDCRFMTLLDRITIKRKLDSLSRADNSLQFMIGKFHAI